MPSTPSIETSTSAAIQALNIKPPSTFLAEETTASWRAPLAADLKDPRAMQTQMPVRPNLIVHRRKVAADKDVGELVAVVCADLVRHIEGLSTIDSSAFSFDDGQEGLLIKYTIPAHQNFQLAQMQAARLDGDVFTTVTISTELSRLSDEVVADYLAALASDSPNA